MLSSVALLGCGPEELFVNAPLALDDSCEALPDDAHVDERPVFDISPGAHGGSEACDDPFVVPLWVDNPNGERVRVTEVEVTLETPQRQRLFFDRGDSPLPNPFHATATGTLPPGASGVVDLELIPKAYALQLGDFVGDRLDVVLLLIGKTSSGDQAESARARIPIEICDGCRTLCATDPDATDATCSDPDLGPLREACVDPGC